MLVVRPATAEDAPFLRRMLAAAANWRPEVTPRSLAEIMADPALAHYVTGWPGDGDTGVIAEDDGPVGASWWRHFLADDPGYGFVDESIPEVSIGDAAEHRQRGIGTRLLSALIDEARRRNLPALSLSVEADNPAARLYERLGFNPVRHDAGAVTMIVRVGP